MRGALDLIVQVRPEPPAWVQSALDERLWLLAGLPSHSSGTSFALRRACLRNAVQLYRADLVSAVREAYVDLGQQLKADDMCAARCWNFVPDIHGSAGACGTRYMAFNAGRYQGFLEWYGSGDNFFTRVPTASTVGITGPDLDVFVLGSPQVAIPVENPRQRSSYQYSARFGAIPPCFARATRIHRRCCSLAARRVWSARSRSTFVVSMSKPASRFGISSP